jgi:hypothetical protein
MDSARAAPAMMVLGGILTVVAVFLGSTTLTLTWQGQVIASGSVGGTRLSLLGGGLMILAGLLWWFRRTYTEGIAVIGASLALIGFALAWARSLNIGDSLEALGLASATEQAKLDEWLAHGATLKIHQSVGLYLLLAGGVIGLAGGVFAVRERRLARSLPSSAG